jgi:hypothetical protein
MKEQITIKGWEKTLFMLWPEEVEIDKRCYPAIKTLLCEQAKFSYQQGREEAVLECLNVMSQSNVEGSESRSTTYDAACQLLNKKQ